MRIHQIPITSLGIFPLGPSWDKKAGASPALPSQQAYHSLIKPRAPVLLGLSLAALLGSFGCKADDGSIAQDGPSAPDGRPDYDGPLADAMMDGPFAMDGGSVDGNTDAAVDPFCLPMSGVGNGTPASPYTFRLLVYVDEATRAASVSRGWNVEAGVADDIAQLGAIFNNGELSDHYAFNLLDIQYPTLSSSSPLSTVATPENEDFLVVYDERIAGNSYTAVANTIRFGGVNIFDPSSPNGHLIAHEMGHARGAIDMYSLCADALRNEVYPGSGYCWSGVSYMGTSGTYGPTWDPLSRHLLHEAGADPKIDFRCSSYRLAQWLPNVIQTTVTDGQGNPVAGAAVDFYRMPYGEPALRPGMLWFSDITDGTGSFQFPAGLTEYPGLYGVFLGAVHYAGQTYLNWYDITDIVLPYHDGITTLTLPAVVSTETLYVPPVPTGSDLAAMDVTFSPSSVHGGGSLMRSVRVYNGGPDSYAGNIAVQWYLSADNALDGSDRAVGGYSYSVSLTSGGSQTFNVSPAISATVPAGDYYLIAKVTPQAAGVTDPVASNNAGASTNPVTLLAP